MKEPKQSESPNRTKSPLQRVSNVLQMKKTSTPLIILVFIALTHNSEAQVQHKSRLTKNWEFLKGDLGGIWEAVRDIGEGSIESALHWNKVDLPHCFNAEDAVDPDRQYYQGAGWYRTFIEINNPYQKGRVLLHFEGAGQKTEVYIYTTKVGSHVGGYDEWTVDITDRSEEHTSELQ